MILTDNQHIDEALMGEKMCFVWVWQSVKVEAMRAFICSFNLKTELLDWMFIYRSAALWREILDNSFSLPLSVIFFQGEIVVKLGIR